MGYSGCRGENRGAIEKKTETLSEFFFMGIFVRKEKEKRKRENILFCASEKRTRKKDRESLVLPYRGPLNVSAVTR